MIYNEAVEVDKKKRVNEIELASSLFSALNSGVEVLEASTYNIPLQEYLDKISQVSSADRTYIFLNHSGASGGKYMSLIAEWCGNEITSEIDNPELQNLSFDKSFPRWYDCFLEGELIFGPIKTFPEKEKKILQKRGVKSLLMAPLFSCGEFTGFIGFDKCKSEDDWGILDLEYIKLSAYNLSRKIEKDWVFKRLESENNLFTTVMDAMDVIISAIDYETFEVVYMNKYAIDKLGDGVGLKCWNVFHEGAKDQCIHCKKDKLIEDDGSFNEPYIWEYYYFKIHKWCMSSSQALKWPDGRTVIFQISTDITELKKSETLLEKSLEEKDSLLSEVHHRVKNNLQSLMYLISMQADFVESPKAVEVLDELRERVQAMSLVHTHLYQSKDLSNIDFKEYVSNLIDILMKALTRDHIDTFIDIPNIHLDIKLAIPCGLIINELVTNILKHAFQDKSDSNNTPEIHVSMKKSMDKFVLKVGDNGGGFKMPRYFNENKSLGLKLVNIWATHQLRGTLEINEISGVEFIITFPQK